jgi:hypothetical protein
MSTPPAASASDDNNDWIREDCRDFYNEHLSGANRCKQRTRLIRLAVNQAYGLQQRFAGNAQFLEFGVHEGKDITRIAAFLASLDKNATVKAPTTIHGFDSFEGLPEDWNNGQYETDGTAVHKAGAFDVKGEAPVIDKLHQLIDLGGRSSPITNVVFHKGWFDSTVPDFFDQHVHPVAFIHADADLYSSTKTFLEEICCRRLLKAGSVILFDEFWNFEDWQEGEYKAWMEFVEEYDIQFCYLAIHAPTTSAKDFQTYYGYQSVCVLIQRDMR